MNEVKGWKTSEFYFMLLAQVATLLFASGLVAEGSAFEKVLGLIASVLGAIGYAVVRGGVKKASSAAAALTTASRASQALADVAAPDPT